MLGRSLVEALGVMALIEEPRTRDALFRQDGYREGFKAQELMKAAYGNAPKFARVLAAEDKSLRSMARYLRLSADEPSDPEHNLDSWPRPVHLVM